MPSTPLALDPHSKRLRHVCAMDDDRVTEAQVRNARHAYYGEIAYVDDQIGRLMQALRAVGLAEDTIVIVTSDHGEMLGERGLWYKMSFLDGAARVPLIIAAPGRFAPGRVGRERVARRSHADARSTSRAATPGRSAARSTGAALGPICAGRRATTRRSANIWRKGRLRRSS